MTLFGGDNDPETIAPFDRFAIDSQSTRAKAAPAAAAATAVKLVWLVANRPWILPTSAGAEPWVKSDWTAGMAAANPRASRAPRATRAGTSWTKG